MADIQEWHQGQELLCMTPDKRCGSNVSVELEKWGLLYAHHGVYRYYPACLHQPRSIYIHSCSYTVISGPSFYLLQPLAALQTWLKEVETVSSASNIVRR